MVLNLAIGDLNCSEAMKDIRSYACKNNSVSQDSNNGPGHRCNCSEGFKGNHYHPQGSQDIDKGQIPLYASKYAPIFLVVISVLVSQDMTVMERAAEPHKVP